MPKYRVRCTVYVDVDLPEGSDAKFIIEENGCPGTGAVGAAIDAAMAQGEKDHVCWGCTLEGENEIVDSDAVQE